MNLIAKIIFPVVLILLFSTSLHAQCGSCVKNCPTNEADLANGETFCGTYTVAGGGSVTITGKVI